MDRLPPIPPGPQASGPVVIPPHQPGLFTRPMAGIETPTSNDVLCGRGVTTNRHPGNENFRAIVSRNKDIYVTSTKKQKMTISRSIVETVRSLSPPGRFLEKQTSSGLWFDIGDKKAVEKTSQALRDSAASLRKQLSEDLSDPDFLSAVFDSEDAPSDPAVEKVANQKKKNIPNHRRTRSSPAATFSHKTQNPAIKKQRSGDVSSSVVENSLQSDAKESDAQRIFGQLKPCPPVPTPPLPASESSPTVSRRRKGRRHHRAQSTSAIPSFSAGLVSSESPPPSFEFNDEGITLSSPRISCRSSTARQLPPDSPDLNYPSPVPHRGPGSQYQEDYRIRNGTPPPVIPGRTSPSTCHHHHYGWMPPPTYGPPPYYHHPPPPSGGYPRDANGYGMPPAGGYHTSWHHIGYPSSSGPFVKGEITHHRAASDYSDGMRRHGQHPRYHARSLSDPSYHHHAYHPHAVSSSVHPPPSGQSGSSARHVRHGSHQRDIIETSQSQSSHPLRRSQPSVDGNVQATPADEKEHNAGKENGGRSCNKVTPSPVSSKAPDQVESTDFMKLPDNRCESPTKSMETDDESTELCGDSFPSPLPFEHTDMDGDEPGSPLIGLNEHFFLPIESPSRPDEKNTVMTDR